MSKKQSVPLQQSTDRQQPPNNPAESNISAPASVPFTSLRQSKEISNGEGWAAGKGKQLLTDGRGAQRTGGREQAQELGGHPGARNGKAKTTF